MSNQTFTADHTDAFIVMEHYFESDGAFKRCTDQFRENYGSYAMRESMSNIANNIEQAYYSLNQRFDSLGDTLMEKCGCWDFEVVPEVLERMYEERTGDDAADYEISVAEAEACIRSIAEAVE